MRLTRRALALGLLGAAAGAAARPARADGPASGPAAAKQVQVKARPVESFDIIDGGLRRFGELEFIGGMDLESADPHFGGWSGLSLSPDGRRLLAISDVGGWLSGTITYTEQTPTGSPTRSSPRFWAPTARRSGGRAAGTAKASAFTMAWPMWASNVSTR